VSFHEFFFIFKFMEGITVFFILKNTFLFKKLVVGADEGISAHGWCVQCYMMAKPVFLFCPQKLHCVLFLIRLCMMVGDRQFIADDCFFFFYCLFSFFHRNCTSNFFSLAFLTSVLVYFLSLSFYKSLLCF